MKTLLCTLILATLGTAAAKADSVTITFDKPSQFVLRGGTIEFFGTITNDSSTTVFLNSDDLNLAGLSLATNDLFFSTVPISLAPFGQAGDSSGDIELFDVSASSPLLDPVGKYLGSYSLFGGGDGNGQDDLGTASFSVTTVPEPASIYLLLGALPVAIVVRSRVRATV